MKSVKIQQLAAQKKEQVRTKIWPQEYYPEYKEALKRHSLWYQHQLHFHLYLCPNFEPVIYKGKILLSHHGILSSPLDGNFGLSKMHKYYEDTPEWKVAYEQLSDNQKARAVKTEKSGSYVSHGELHFYFKRDSNDIGRKFVRWHIFGGIAFDYRLPFNKYGLPGFIRKPQCKGLTYRIVVNEKGEEEVVPLSTLFGSKPIKVLGWWVDYKNIIEWHLVGNARKMNEDNKNLKKNCTWTATIGKPDDTGLFPLIYDKKVDTNNQ